MRAARTTTPQSPTTSRPSTTAPPSITARRQIPALTTTSDGRDDRAHDGAPSDGTHDDRAHDGAPSDSAHDDRTHDDDSTAEDAGGGTCAGTSR